MSKCLSFHFKVVFFSQTKMKLNYLFLRNHVLPFLWSLIILKIRHLYITEINR